MYKICKTEQSAARQQELAQGLLAAMAVRKYEDISVSDLCQHLGVTRKSFYRYFSGKDGALDALIDQTLMELENAVMTQDESQMPEAIRSLERFFSFWQRKKPLLDALARNGLQDVLVKRSVDYCLSGAHVSGQSAARHRPEFREYAVKFGTGGLMYITLTWHRDGYPLPADQMAQIARDLITRPLFPVP